MIENRELTIDDYLAMLKRRYRLVLVPTLIAPLIGFGISYLVTPKYTSTTTVLVEAPKVTEGYVKPVTTEDLIQRLIALRQRVINSPQLRSSLHDMGLPKDESADEAIAEISQNTLVLPLSPDVTAAKKKPGQSADVPAFQVSVTARNPQEAQQVCAKVTDLLLRENLESRQQLSSNTTDFLSHQLVEAKNSLDSLDSKLALFKKQNWGKLPGDVDNALKLLQVQQLQLDATTQALNRAQQDKTYSESDLAQQLAAWKSSQGNTNPQTLQQQLTLAQSQLVTLQARYTDDHPDVVKVKNDIAEIKRKLKEMDEASANATDTSDKENASEPIEIRKLRLQVHQYAEAIAQYTRQQKVVQDNIRATEGRLALSPTVEEQYKQLTRDYDTAQKSYNDLLAKKSESTMQSDLELQQQGEHMRLVVVATLPDSPSFPNRWLFAGGGLAAGLFLGMAIAMWLELRDKAIRNEQDVIAALELPMLVAVPWVVPGSNGNGNGRYGGSKAADTKKERVEV